MSVSIPGESSTRPTFSGTADEDVAVFIHNIQRVAFGMGRQRDNDWQADYAATCLTGNAIRWYSELEDDNIRYNWTLLRRALSQQFPLPVPAITVAPTEETIEEAPPAYETTLQVSGNAQSVTSLAAPNPSRHRPRLSETSRHSWNEAGAASDQISADDLSQQRRRRSTSATNSSNTTIEQDWAPALVPAQALHILPSLSSPEYS
ncbi:hypothetical protein FRB95_005198 [Tulasnella sp. JGI-2019a]|nr:hypothetical protein FRB95_005198 [Tulasnella sp. JGI-2019a]